MNFSVLLSVYRKENPEYLKQSIDSIFTQTVPPTEIVMVEDGLYALGLSWAAATFSFASFLMVLLLIAAGIYFFFRDGRRYWWQMGQQNGVPTSYKKYVYMNPGFLFYVIIFGMEMLSYMMK